MKDKIDRWVEDHKNDVIALTQSLVRIPSVNKPPHGEERACQMFVADFLRDLGCTVDVFTPAEVEGLTDHPAYWPGRDYTDRPNVVGVLKGSGAGKSLLFSGHIDVVAPIGEGQFGWWDGTIHDGKLYGRGSNDMKGGIAAYLMAARCVKELGLKIKGDVILETVVDEEVAGANGTLACRLRGYNADAAVVPEPNSLAVSAAHHGGKQFRIYVTGNVAGMGFDGSALPDPIVALGHIVVALEKYDAERNACPKPPGFEHATFPFMPFVIRAGELFPWGTQDAIPDSAFLEFWIEVPPGVTEDELESELKRVVDETTELTPALQRVETRWESRTRFLPGSSIPLGSPIITVLSDNLAAVTGRLVSHAPAAMGCDVFMFNLHSPTPCVVLGPCGGNAHAPDEWVETEDLIALTRIFAATIVDWCEVEM
jgi:acetylornithine deacetylase